jgi:hypothetical protein
MPDEPESEELDLEALADSLFGNGDGTPEPQANQEGEGEADSSESSNEEPTEDQETSPYLQFTNSEEADAWFTNRITALASEAEVQQASEARAAEINRLLAEGNDEELGKLVREAAVQERTRSAVGTEVLAGYQESLINEALPNDFVSSLSAEETERLDPDRFQDVTSYLLEVQAVKAERSFNGSLEQEIDRRATEKFEAMKTRESAGRIRSASPSAVPGVNDALPDAIGSPDGLWAQAMEEVNERAHR